MTDGRWHVLRPPKILIVLRAFLKCTFFYYYCRSMETRCWASISQIGMLFVCHFLIKHELPTMVPTNQTSALPRASAGLRVRQLDSIKSERLPKLSLPGGCHGILHVHSQHKQASPTPRSSGTTVDNHPSRPIPLPRTHIPRTISEVQLREDIAVAEWREMCMFHRLVEGMKERQQAQQHGTSCCGSQDSTAHPSSTRQLPKTITPQESPVFVDDSDRSAFLVEMLYRASELGDLTTETSTTGPTITSSSSATANSNKQQQQQAQLVRDSDWSLEGFAFSSITATTSSFVHNDDKEDEGIFTLDL